MLWILRRTRLSGAAALLNTLNNNNGSSDGTRWRRLEHCASVPPVSWSCLCGCCGVHKETVAVVSAASILLLVLVLCVITILVNRPIKYIPRTGTDPYSRPARKDYNKLSGEEQTARNNRTGGEQLDNEPPCKGSGGCGNNSLDSDTDSSFTDLEMDEREDFSDDSDYEESLTCNVCDRTFACNKQLSSHKQKKRHFGCSACDSLFPSLMALEHHKEEFEHWSEDEDILTDSEEEDDTVISEECERLL